MECAVLFADIAGSTALYEVLGDECAFALVEACLSTMSRCTTENRGRVIKTIGDAVLSVFPTSDDAAAAAIAMQTHVEALGPGNAVRPGLRIGFHFGPVMAHAQDVFGDSVNLASRLCDLASRGQVVCDRETAQGLSEAHRAAALPLYAVPVKGKAQDVELVEIAWQAGGDEKTLIVVNTQPGHGPPPPALLALDLGDRHIEMGPERRKVTVGREPEADFCIPERSVSRAHARIERRREHFVLADHSANGSFVSFDGRPEIRVHHEELTLVGQGWLSFGQRRAEARQVVQFRCVDAGG